MAFFSGSSPDGTIDINPNNTALSPVVPTGTGGRFYTSGEQDFCALTKTDTLSSTSGQLYDWGHP
jgi:hypothetical protein